MQLDPYQKRQQLPQHKKQKWIKQQTLIRSKILQSDSFTWTLNNLQLVAGVDISFSGKYKDAACAGLVIYSVKYKKIVYEDYIYVILQEEYIPGFLAFRQLPPTLHLFKKLKERRPELYPQVVLVDGNGILHKNQCGYASHLGVVLDLPTIGCAKSFFDIDGLHQEEVEKYLRDKLENEGEGVRLKGKSGKEWCHAILVNQNEGRHLYVSVGHRVGLDSAEKVVKLVTRWEGPEPVRLVDKISRKMIKKMGEGQFQSAGKYEMVYFS